MDIKYLETNFIPYIYLLFSIPQSSEEDGTKPVPAACPSGSSNQGSVGDGGSLDDHGDSTSEGGKSSELTPSDNRSNDEATSSLKESDASMKNMKGSPVASSSSNEEDGQTVPKPAKNGNENPPLDLDALWTQLFVWGRGQGAVPVAFGLIRCCVPLWAGVSWVE